MGHRRLAAWINSLSLYTGADRSGYSEIHKINNNTVFNELLPKVVLLYILEGQGDLVFKEH